MKKPTVFIIATGAFLLLMFQTYIHPILHTIIDTYTANISNKQQLKAVRTGNQIGAWVDSVDYKVDDGEDDYED